MSALMSFLMWYKFKRLRDGFHSVFDLSCLGRLLASGVLGFCLSACQSGSSQLDVQLKYRDVVLVDTKGRSCVSHYNSPGDPPDLSPVKAILGGFTVNWKGAAPLEIVYVRIRLDLGQESNSVVIISGEELSALMTGNPSAPTVVLPANSSIDTTALVTPCPWEIGGINIADKSRSIYGNASILIYAVTQESPPKVVQASQVFSFRFIGLND